MNFKTTIPKDKSSTITLNHTNYEREYKCTKPLLVVKYDGALDIGVYVHRTKEWIDVDMGGYKISGVVKWCDIGEELKKINNMSIINELNKRHISNIKDVLKGVTLTPENQENLEIWISFEKAKSYNNGVSDGENNIKYII